MTPTESWRRRLNELWINGFSLNDLESFIAQELKAAVESIDVEMDSLMFTNWTEDELRGWYESQRQYGIAKANVLKNLGICD